MADKIGKGRALTSRGSDPGKLVIAFKKRSPKINRDKKAINNKLYIIRCGKPLEIEWC